MRQPAHRPKVRACPIAQLELLTQLELQSYLKGIAQHHHQRYIKPWVGGEYIPIGVMH